MNKQTRSNNDSPPNGSRFNEAGMSDETERKQESRTERSDRSEKQELRASGQQSGQADMSFAHELADRVEGFLAGTRFKRTYDQIETFAQARPMLAVAIGVLAGALFGRRLIRLIF
jgi:hypothetical protein